MKLSLAHLMSYLPCTLSSIAAQQPATASNGVQFQKGLSQAEFFERFGSEAQCAQAVERMRWPEDFRCPRCPRCHAAAHSRIVRGGRTLFQCAAYRHQASAIAGTMMDSTKLPLRR